ncbi:hypothetical protein ACF0H5_017191 [Mactra antiquata]
MSGTRSVNFKIVICCNKNLPDMSKGPTVFAMSELWYKLFETQQSLDFSSSLIYTFKYSLFKLTEDGLICCSYYSVANSSPKSRTEILNWIAIYPADKVNLLN